MTITVTRDLTQPMRHIVHIRNHLVPSDAGASIGGLDAGPSPHDLYDAALGACKALTMVWYARRNGIPVEDIKVHVARDAGHEREGLYHLIASIEVSGDLSLEQRSELMDAAARCPVQKLMSSVKTEITTLMV